MWILIYIVDYMFLSICINVIAKLTTSLQTYL